jgi:alpha-glucosidase
MNPITRLVLAVRFLGVRGVLRSVRYSIFKALTDRGDTGKAFMESHIPGKLKEASEIPSGGRFTFSNVELEIVFLAPDLARITWGSGIPPVPYALARTEWEPAQVDLSKHGEIWILESTRIKIQVDSEGSLRYVDSMHRVIRHELPPVFQGTAWRHRARLSADERIYGLGEQAGPFNLRKERRRMWNSDPGGSYGPGRDPIYAPMPVYAGMHSAGSYMIFYENSFPGYFDFQAPDPELPAGKTGPGLASTSFVDGLLRCYFIPGSPRRALERFTELTGRPALPPRWSLGYHQSRWGYKTEKDVREVVAGFKARDLPLSAVHLDIDYMDEYRVFTVDQARFPDLAALARDLKQEGVRLVTIIDPGVKQDPEFEMYRDGIKQEVFCTLRDGYPSVGLVWPGWSLFPDFTNPKTRAWWGGYYARLLEAGVDGFWHDMNEPTSFSAWGDISLPLTTQHDLEGSGGSHHQAHNVYGLQMNRAAYEALRSLSPDRRPWLFSRAGWVSQQRYAWNWTGDSESTWSTPRMTIATVLGLSLSGQPYSGPDIGGFSGRPSAELFLRHFQMAAFMPFFRTHSAVGTKPREPWVFGEPYTTILRSFLKLRCALLPYWYTLAWQASQTGMPLVRPVFWGQENDRRLWTVDDAFLLGQALLVAPILDDGARGRAVRLPAGGWYHYWDDAYFQGPGEIELPAPLERMPLLVRASSVLPMEEDGRLALHLYAPQGEDQQPSQDLYSDAGDGYGPSRVDTFFLEARESGLELRWAQQGDFPFPYSSIDIHLHGFQASQVRVDESDQTLQANHLRVDQPFRLALFFEQS